MQSIGHEFKACRLKLIETFLLQNFVSEEHPFIKNEWCIINI